MKNAISTALLALAFSASAQLPASKMPIYELGPAAGSNPYVECICGEIEGVITVVSSGSDAEGVLLSFRDGFLVGGDSLFVFYQTPFSLRTWEGEYPQTWHPFVRWEVNWKTMPGETFVIRYAITRKPKKRA